MSIQPWDDLGKEVIETMRELGRFQPTVRPENAELKGIQITDEGDVCKAYLEPKDLRRIAKCSLIVADWLDARKDEFERTEKGGDL